MAPEDPTTCPLPHKPDTVQTHSSASSQKHLVLIRLLLVADGHVAGIDIQVDLVVTGNGPAALLCGSDALDLQLGLLAQVPLLACGGQAIRPAEHVHCPEEGARHGAPCQRESRAPSAESCNRHR